MGNFFKPWQRKIAFVTLVTGFFLTGLWAISYVADAHFDFPGGSIMSAQGRFDVLFTESDVEVQNPLQNGVHLRERKDVSVCDIPYWIVVVLLASLSAFMLLVKPRVSKPNSANENPPPN